MRKSTLLRALTLTLLGVGSLPACFSSQGEPSPLGTDAEGVDASSGDDAGSDVATAPVDAGMDAGFDATVAAEGSPEAEPDQTAAETSAEDAPPEASPEPTGSETLEPEPEAASDVAVVEAGLDATLADAGLDAALGADAAPEAAVDAGSDATVVDAALDGASEASDAGDASSFCIAQIFGDHYLRPDGELVYGPGSSHTIVVDAMTSAPLLGMGEIDQQSDHACGVRSDGTVWCWALTSSAGFGNTNGDLGNGTVGGTNLGVGVATQVVTTPADAGAPAYLTGVAHLSTASDTQYTRPTCAIRSDKTVWCWGDTSSEGGYLFQGTTGSNASVPYAIPIAASAGDGGPPPALTADQVSVGLRHACVLLAGKVSCWGQNVAGNLANGDPSLAYKPYPLPVIAGYGLPATVDAIGSGSDFSCALAGGSVWCWGTASANQIGNPSAPTSFCNLNYCQPQPTPVQASAPDGGTSQVPDAGVDQNPLVDIGSIVVGYQFACALDASGLIWCWGANVGGSQYLPMAQPHTSATVPYTNVTHIAAWGEGVSDGLRYTTASGVYVSAGQEQVPFCL
jgi:alpha-tubulin suppressor-like RCC1 family protein